MRVMAMVMVESQHQGPRLRDGMHAVNSKDSMVIIGIRDGVFRSVSSELSAEQQPNQEAC